MSIDSLLKNTVNNYPSRVRNFIRGYDDMLDKISNIVKATIHKDRSTFNILDMGCGTGELASNILKQNFNPLFLTCIDSCPSAIAKAKKTLKQYINIERLSIQKCNIFNYAPTQKFNTIIANLFFASYTIEQKLRIINKFFSWLPQDTYNGSGVFIWGDRINFSNKPILNQAITLRREAAKKNNEAKKIINLAFAQEEKSYPLTIQQTFALLNLTPFSKVDCVWVHDNFAIFTAVQ